METLTVTSLFWFIAIGLAAGWIFGRIIRREGISLYANIIWGVIGAVTAGIIFEILQLGDATAFSMIGSLAVLFLVNVFHQHHDEEILGHGADERLHKLP